MRILKVLFLILVASQTALSIGCYIQGVWGFMENIAFAIQLGFILLGLALGLSGLKLIGPAKTTGRQVTGWILFILSSGFAIFMIIQNFRLILNPPHWPFG